MATSTRTGKNKGPVVDPGLCRCCRSIKKCRLLTADYEWMGRKEVYSDMFMDCFGFLFSHIDGDSKDTCVCATCVVRLRDACAFRQQVLQSEELFLNTKLENKDDKIGKIEVIVKSEPVEVNDSDCIMDDRDELPIENLDNEILNKSSLKKLNKCIVNKKCKRERICKSKDKIKLTTKSDLVRQMNKLRNKLDHMLDKPVKSVDKRQKYESKTSKSKLDHNEMTYINAVTIVLNSYVCPFQNRISIYYCYYCRDQFTNPDELREHNLVHDPKKMFECMMDNRKVPKIDITRVDCRLCNEKIDSIDSFKSHISKVHAKKIYPVSNEFIKFKLTMENLTCTECGLIFPFFDQLTKHMIDHFGTFICDMCGACFLEPNSLRTHIKSHSKVDVNYPCDVCGKNLKSKYSKYLHIATVHEKKPTVNCYKCEASFLSYAQRNKHWIEVHGDKRTFPCKLCDKVYNRRKTLIEHNRRNHLKILKHQCDLCDQRFYVPSRLKEHMATHTGERNFRCEFCDKSYPRFQSLQEHIRSHNSEKRYKCDVCNSLFTQNGSLKSHMKSHHQGYDLEASYS